MFTQYSPWAGHRTLSSGSPGSSGVAGEIGESRRKNDGLRLWFFRDLISMVLKTVHGACNWSILTSYGMLQQPEEDERVGRAVTDNGCPQAVLWCLWDRSRSGHHIFRSLGKTHNAFIWDLAPEGGWVLGCQLSSFIGLRSSTWNW